MKIPFISSPISVVKSALDLAKVSHDDVVLDIGCGDGRVPIVAAKYFGSRGICVELDDNICALAEANVIYNKVDKKVSVVCQDFFKFDYSIATVLYAYLYGSILSLISEKIETELRRGSRVLTIDFPIEGWVPLKIRRIIDEGGVIRSIYMYVIGISNPSSWVLF